MDDYKVIRAIGKGSFGKVYLTKFLKDNRQYVMKVIKLKGIPPKERCVSRERATFAARARGEARVLPRLVLAVSCGNIMSCERRASGAGGGQTGEKARPKPECKGRALCAIFVSRRRAPP